MCWRVARVLAAAAYIHSVASQPGPIEVASLKKPGFNYVGLEDGNSQETNNAGGLPPLGGSYNGPPSSGLVSNGLVSNGLVSNGLVSNGLASNGLASNGLASNGLTASDPGPDPSLPILNLGYGAYRAQPSPNGHYVFSNIPYAAPPLGSLRWAAPERPLKTKYVNETGHLFNIRCPQAPLEVSTVRSLTDDLISKAFSAAPSAGPEDLGFTQDVLAVPQRSSIESEDCLYLDIYLDQEIPKKLGGLEEYTAGGLLKARPAIVYFHGGPVDFGSGAKSDVNFQSLLSDSGGSIVIVVNNRLGAFGFLHEAASASESPAFVQNVGLYDQATALSWVRLYGELLGIDKDNIAVWGRDHGATSLIYHTAAGTQFSRAVLESPSSLPMRKVGNETSEIFRQFAKIAGCEGQSVTCLRAASTESLQTANRGMYQALAHELEPPFVPIPEGVFAEKNPLITFADKNELSKTSGINKKDILVATTLAESEFLNKAGRLFNPAVDSIEAYIGRLNPSSSTWQTKSRRLAALISSRYPQNTTSSVARWTSLSQRCLLSTLSNAFPQRTYAANLQNMSLTDLIEPAMRIADNNGVSRWQEVGDIWRAYLSSFASDGDPNLGRKDKEHFGVTAAELRVQWPVVSGVTPDSISSVLTNDVTQSSQFTVENLKADQEICSAWLDLFRD